MSGKGIASVLYLVCVPGRPSACVWSVNSRWSGLVTVRHHWCLWAQLQAREEDSVCSCCRWLWKGIRPHGGYGISWAVLRFSRGRTLLIPTIRGNLSYEWLCLTGFEIAALTRGLFSLIRSRYTCMSRRMKASAEWVNARCKCTGILTGVLLDFCTENWRGLAYWDLLHRFIAVLC